MYQFNKILKRTVNDPNEIIDCNNYYEICIYNNKCEEIARTKIDKEDLEKVKSYKWHINDQGYILSGDRKRLHQLILGKKQELEIDHINHDTLDNRKQNLRHCTSSQNSMNKKNVKGISWHKKANKWTAQIVSNYKHIYLGLFENKRDAINARRKAEKQYFGEFRNL